MPAPVRAHHREATRGTLRLIFFFLSLLPLFVKMGESHRSELEVEHETQTGGSNIEMGEDPQPHVCPVCGSCQHPLEDAGQVGGRGSRSQADPGG